MDTQPDNLVADGSAAGTAKSPTKPAVVKARKRQLIKMTPELLISSNGLIKLGESAAKLKFKSGPTSNASNMHAIMQMYETWAQNLCPSVSFEEFLIKSERFGRSATIRSVVEPLFSSTETQIREKLGLDDSDDDELQQDEAEAPERPNETQQRDSHNDMDGLSQMREPEFSQTQ